MYSHTQTIKGKIIDVFGHPIENVYVLNTTTENHAHTNELGVFSIENILKISSLGYKKAVFTITDEAILITLKEDSFQLSVVIIQPNWQRNIL